MLSKIKTATLLGIKAITVDVEVDVSFGIPGFNLVGLPMGAVREGMVRIRSAIENSGFNLGSIKVTANLAPADVRKQGAGFDLPIAIGVLASKQKVSLESRPYLIAGELSLNGRLKPIRGALSLAKTTRDHKLAGLVLPRANVEEAAILSGIEVFGVESLSEAWAFLNDKTHLDPASPSRISPSSHKANVDFAEVSGEPWARRAAEIAAAGGHHLLLIGPPGSGKTMIAKRMNTILPPLSMDEIIETTMIHSVAGLQLGHSLKADPPFRAPHHTASSVGLIGGGNPPRPGEISLAHNGVLFLDELPEFQRAALETLRQPLEDGAVSIVRSGITVTYPARFMLVAAMNPCPCGYRGSQARVCTCGEREAYRYRHRISGPLLERFDLFVEMQGTQTPNLYEQGDAEASAAIATRVTEARDRQKFRYRRSLIRYNSELSGSAIRRWAKLNHKAQKFLEQYAQSRIVSARALHRICKVGRTIADIDGKDAVNSDHLSLAILLHRGDFTQIGNHDGE